eukprot:g33100.t1
MTWDAAIYGLFPGTYTEANINCICRTINSVKDALWSARNLLVFPLKELTLTECCGLAYAKVQNYRLRDTLKITLTAAKVQWEKATMAKDISEQLHDILKGEGEQPEVVVHIGTNDIDRKREKWSCR